MWYKLKESFFLIILKSVVGDVTVAEERILKERERREEGRGVEFWEISGREEDEKRGFGCRGITPRCGEWETGIQRDSSISF